MRFFVALDLPEFVVQKCENTQRLMTGTSWTPRHNYHITLKFIGETETECEESIAQALDEIEIAPFILECSGVGVFPEKGPPQVLWAGMGKSPPQFFQLQHKVENIVFRLGFDPGKRAFRPHLTLARLDAVPPVELKQWLRDNETFATAPFSVTDFYLYASEGERDARRYTKRARFPLRKKKA